FGEVARRVGHGQRLADALTALVDGVGEPIRPVVAAITGTERYGAPLGPMLELLAHEARHERRRRAEEAARTLPVKLCFPLVGCLLPAFVLLPIAPLIAGAIRSVTVSSGAMVSRTKAGRMQPTSGWRRRSAGAAQHTSPPVPGQSRHT